MYHKTLFKSLRRELRGSLNRFISIFAITALGGSFFVGLTSIGPDMLLTANHYYEANQLADYRLLSSFGFTEDDITALEESGDYSAVSAGYGLDVLVEGTQGPVPVRIHSIPQGADDTSQLNRPEILQGRYPEAANECLADATGGEAIGDVVMLSPETSEDAQDLLTTQEFTVVGIAESPYYIYHTRGNTELGDGQLSRFYLVLPSAFDSEYYLEVFLRDSAAEGLDSFDDAYDATQSSGEERLEAFAQERESIRYNEIMQEAEVELADAREELLEGQIELADAKAEAEVEFADAEAELAEAKAELVAGQDELTAGQNELVAAREALESGRRELSTQAALLQNGQNAQAAGEADLAAGRASLEAERNALLEGQAAYEAGLSEYNAGLATYQSGLAAWQEAERGVLALRSQYEASEQAYLAAESRLNELKNGTESLAAKSETLGSYVLPAQEADYRSLGTEAANQLEELLAILPEDSAQKTALQNALVGMRSALLLAYDAGLIEVKTLLDDTVLPLLDTEISDQSTALVRQKTELDGFLSTVQSAESALAGQKEPLEIARVQLEQSQVALLTSQAQLQAGMVALAQAEAELNAGAEQLQQSAQQIEQGSAQLNAASAQLSGAESDIQVGESELSDAETELADGWADFFEGQQDLAQARAEADLEFADAEEELADAEAELADAEAELADLEMPEWFVQTREAQPGYSSFENSVDSLRALAGVFPVFFFLVSTLVCLTTMTRMVEEKRTQIGALKALGYSKAAIAFEYLFYGSVASLSGAVVGAAFGVTVFPIILWEAYSLMYNMPSLSLAIHPVYVPLSIGVSVLSTAGATLAACLGELHSVPAMLMRPKAPRAGKRILLERIPFLWKRMNFIQKVTSRNIFRYKKRFLMTIIGVAGCTALLLTGFGLNDTIGRVIPLQFEKINNYDATIILSEPSSSQEDSQLNETLSSFVEWLYFDQYSVEVDFEDKTSGNMAVYLFVPEQTQQLQDFLRFYDPQTEEPFYLGDTEGVVLTQKLADVLGIQAGDTATLYYDDAPLQVPVAAIAENYFSNYVYITPEFYENIFGKNPEFDSVWLKTAEDVETQTALEAILQDDNVLGALDTVDFRREFSDMMSGLDAVVLLAIVSAGALGVVVLYNLTNINITERTREIATLKVLGFYPREFAAYIYRESFFLTLLGSLFGLLLGVALHRFVMQAAMVDDLLFSPYIAPGSYFLSVVFTLFSLAIVDALMLRNLYKIDSIESLKSTE